MTAIEYIRNTLKRVRKKESSVILASQNIDDFLIDGVKEYTKPLFSIPTHHFLFNAGNIEPKVYIDTMQLEQTEFALIKYPKRGLAYIVAVTKDICSKLSQLTLSRKCSVMPVVDKYI